jgi:hypothetical protein
MIDVRASIYKHLPKTLSTAYGDDLPIDWLDREGPVPLDKRHDEFPYGLMAVERRMPIRSTTRSDGTDMRPGDETVETFTFTLPALEYELEDPDVHTLVSVTGTKDGQAHTFTEATVGPSSQDTSWVGQSHLIFDPDEVPDDGTEFTVTYQPILTTVHRRNDIRVTMTFHVVAKDLSVNGNFYDRMELAEQLGTDLESRLMMTAGAVVASDDDRNRLIQGDVEVATPVPEVVKGNTVASYLLRVPFTLTLRPGVTTTTIAKVLQSIDSGQS